MPDTAPSDTLRAAAARLRACSPFVLIAGKRVEVEPLAAEMTVHADIIDIVRERGDDTGTVVLRATMMLAFARSIL